MVAYQGKGRLWRTVLNGCPLASLALAALPAREFGMELEVEGVLPTAYDHLTETPED